MWPLRAGGAPAGGHRGASRRYFGRGRHFVGGSGSAASSSGYAPSSYQNLVYVFPRISACGWSGLAYVGASGVWSNGNNNLLVYGHELGHNFGLLHAGSLDCGAAAVGSRSRFAFLLKRRSN